MLVMVTSVVGPTGAAGRATGTGAGAGSTAAGAGVAAATGGGCGTGCGTTAAGGRAAPAPGGGAWRAQSTAAPSPAATITTESTITAREEDLWACACAGGIATAAAGRERACGAGVSRGWVGAESSTIASGGGGGGLTRCGAPAGCARMGWLGVRNPGCGVGGVWAITGRLGFVL